MTTTFWYGNEMDKVSSVFMVTSSCSLIPVTCKIININNVFIWWYNYSHKKINFHCKGDWKINVGLRGWAEQFIGWLWYSCRILTQMWFISTLSPLRSTHFFHRCCSAWILVARSSPSSWSSKKKSSTADMISSSVYWFPAKLCLGTENSQMVPNQGIWRVINQFKATVTHSSHCSHRFVCRSIVPVKQDSLRQFPKYPEMSLVLLLNS